MQHLFSIAAVLLLMSAVQAIVYDTACKRVIIHVNTTVPVFDANNFFDIDYYIDKNTRNTMFRVSFVSNKPIGQEIHCNGKLLNVSQIAEGAYKRLIHTFYSMQYIDVSSVIPGYSTSSLTVMNMTFTGQIFEDSHEEYYFTENVTLTSSDYLRTGCNDIFNLLYDSKQAIPLIRSITVYVLRPVISIPFAIIFLLLSRGQLGRGRRIYAVISNLAIIFCAILDLIQFGVYFHMANKKGIDMYRTKPYVYIMYALRVISTIGFQIAVAAYSYRNLRYFYIRALYSILSSRRKKSTKNSRLTKWLLSKAAFITLFTVTTVVFQALVIGMAIGVIKLSHKIPKIQSIDYAFYFSTYNMISIAMMIFQLSLVGFTRIRQLLTRGPRTFFFESDPLLFRLEIFILMILFIPCVVVVSILYSFTSTSAKRLYIHTLYILVQIVLGNGIIACIELYRVIRRLLFEKKRYVTKDVQNISNSLVDEELIGVFKKYCMRRQMYRNYQLVTMWKILENAKLEGKMDYQEFVALLDKYCRKLKFSFPSKISQLLNQLLEDHSDKDFIDASKLEPLYNYVFEKIMYAYEHFPESTELHNHMAMRRLLHDEFEVELVNGTMYTDYQLMNVNQQAE
jgi:hypothetical protein